MLFIWLLIATLVSVKGNLEKNKIIFVILSQDIDYYNKKAEFLKNDILENTSLLDKFEPVIYISHKDLDYIGSWTIFPMIPQILKEHPQNKLELVLFCTESTRFNYNNLNKVLNKYDFSKDLFIGHALTDKDATIIHHFALFDRFDLFYPNFATGFIISCSLLKKVSKKVSEEGLQMATSIDASHELALFIHDYFNINLINETNFCIYNSANCASYVEQFSLCDKTVSLDNIYFAVKTCKKFYNERIPVVKKTWAKYVENIEYFSDTNNSTIPTVNLRIENTEHGHCGKTIAILYYIAEKMKENPKILWLAIVDDDTIISPKFLVDHLTCFEPSENVILGERYGYKAFLPNNKGYNYITGGGGMILSREMVLSLVKNDICKCPSINTADDMHLGICVRRIGGKTIHSPKFHQARPPDYSDNYLLTHGAISFHKHWLIDPVKVYDSWFSKYDSKFYNDSKTSYLNTIFKRIINTLFCYLNMCKLYFFNLNVI